jgi:hypothetical protein
MADHECKQEDLLRDIHGRVCSLGAKVDSSINDIQTHILHGATWRLAIVGVVATIAIQIVTFAFLWGRMTQLVDTLCSRVETVERVQYNATLLPKV